MEKSIPAYQRIKQAILENIHAGQWKAGEAIATEMALAEQFGVSRMTVNRALKELSEERVLERRQGSGTFVAQQHFNHTFVELRNIAHDIQADNHIYRAEVLTQTLLKFSELPTSIQTQFSLLNQSGTKAPLITHVALVKIVHHADNIPLQLEERWVNADLLADFLTQDFTQVNTSDYLIAHAPLQGGEYTISAQVADEFIAKALSMKINTPVLLLNRKTLSQNQVITVVNMWHAGDRYRFQGTL